MQIATINNGNNSGYVKELNPNPALINSTVEAIESTKQEANKLRQEAMDSKVSAATFTIGAKEEASKSRIEAEEAAAKSRLEVFSNEKGKKQNQQYQEYLEGSIAENFETKVSLVEERIALMQEISNMRITIAQEKANAELEIRKMQAEADIELEATRKKIKALETSKLKLWVWRIVWPLLGVGCAALTYLLLNI